MVCVQQTGEEQQQEKAEEEEMVELKSWNQQNDNYEDDTQVNNNISRSSLLIEI